MSKVLVLEENLTNIANSIREKTGTEDTYKPSEMATAISSIETGGGSVPEKGFVINEWFATGYPADISIVGLTKIPDYYFHNNWYSSNSNESCLFKYLEKVTLPDNITEIGKYGFCKCDTMVIPNLPDTVLNIGEKAFSDCKALNLKKLPTELTSIGAEAFYNCTKLEITEIPIGVTSINAETFRDCSSLQEITCQGIITNIGSYAFNSCTNLKKIVLPNVTSVPTLGSYAFNSTLIRNGIGYIYVPDTLVDSFKTATNWSTDADQIKPISEMPTE